MRIVARVLLPILFFVSLNAQSRPAQRIDVRVDPRVELLSIIFRLAGAEEFKSPYPAYSAAIDSFFTAYKAHPVTAAVRKLRQERGISFDAVMSFAVHLTDVPELANRMPFEGSALEARWKPDEATAFAALVRDFARESHAERFFEAQRPLYELAAGRMSALIEQHVDQSWFPKFFGPGESSRFILVVALDNGDVAYGTRFYPPSGTRELYAIMNSMSMDAQKLPTFNPGYVPTIVHEFSHSFINPMVDARLADVAKPAAVIHAAVDRAMRGQGYGEPRTMVSESLVRAAVARYVYDHQGIDSASAELTAQRLRSFYWTEDLFALLGAYDHSRERHPTLQDYWPVLAGYFQDLAPRIGGLLAQVDQKRPTVVAMTPANGSPNVDPSTTTLTFTFDRAMRGTFATYLTGVNPREHFPEVLANTWDESRRLFTMKVKLKPAWTYEFLLNSEAGSGFVSSDGYPLKPVRVRFTTAEKSP